MGAATGWRHLAGAGRFGEWWGYKLLPLLAVFYASALVMRLDPLDWLMGALKLLGAIVPGAVFTSVVNDLADRADDARAGKPNRMAGASTIRSALWLVVPLVCGLVWCWLWRDKPQLLLPYLAAWCAFAAYSLPPLRLKQRGLAGVLADASGAHLLPALLAVALAADRQNQLPQTGWALAVGLWSFAYGLRGIVWHQLADRANDVASGTRTLATRIAPERLGALVRWLVFPLELAALLALLIQLHNLLVWAVLGLYGVALLQRVLVWKMRAIIAVPTDRALIVLADFYAVLLPLSLLAVLALSQPLAGLLGLALHCALFPASVLGCLRDLARLEWVQARVIRDVLRGTGVPGRT